MPLDVFIHIGELGAHSEAAETSFSTHDDIAQSLRIDTAQSLRIGKGQGVHREA